MKKTVHFLACIATLALFSFACEQEMVEPTPNEFPKQQIANVNPSPEPTIQPPATPSRNCEVTIYNASSNAYAHLYVAIGTADMDGLKKGLMCPISPGKSGKMCLPQGEITIYPFSNMYQFGKATVVNIGSDPITIRLSSGH